ncbi:hypothetical protein GCM10010424_68360 [Streptomyces lienomycini]
MFVELRFFSSKAKRPNPAPGRDRILPGIFIADPVALTGPGRPFTVAGPRAANAHCPYGEGAHDIAP